MAFTTSRLSPRVSLTPNAQLKSPLLRSPSKSSYNEQVIKLRQVVGTTTSSGNGFDSLDSIGCYAFTAGAVAVVASVNEQGQLSQRFFRTKQAMTSSKPSTSLYDCSTPPSVTQRRRNRKSNSGSRVSGIGLLPPGSPLIDGVDSPGGRSTTTQERTKAATCLSFSPNGRFLAVGEVGYKPRVLLFSMAPDAPTDIPLTVIVEHTFGVRSVAFSPDSQFLATLGDMNDGFLYIWSISHRTGAATLHASNKCITSIKQMAWLGKGLITVGQRHVKIWRIESSASDSTQAIHDDASSVLSTPGHRTLSGRNCLLGALLDQTFTAVVAISETKAIVCSEQGDICLLSDSGASPQFIKIAETGFKTSALSVVAKKYLLAGGQGGQAKSYELATVLSLSSSKALNDLLIGAPLNLSTSSIRAMTFLKHRLVTLDTQRNVQILSIKSGEGASLSTSVKSRFPGHGGAVLGVQSLPMPNDMSVAFLTWSAEGLVNIWDYEGSHKRSLSIPLQQARQDYESAANELKVVKTFQSLIYLVSGDRFGALRITQLSDAKSVYHATAHDGDITDIAIHDGQNTTLIATSGRDRMVQLYRWRFNCCDLLQTLNEHNGAVTGVRFTADGTRMISASSDRTIVIRAAIVDDSDVLSASAFLAVRTIRLKSTPLSMDLAQDALIVSTNDRQVLKYDLQSGSSLSTFKALDSEGENSVVMSVVLQESTSSQKGMIAGVSSTDKSVRMYDMTGRLLGKDYGHTDGITGVAIIRKMDNCAKKSLVTVATDGTVFIWDTLSGAQQMQEAFSALEIAEGSTNDIGSSASRPPPRHVLSSSALARMQELHEGQNDVSKTDPPLPDRSQTLRKKTSRLSMAQTPKLEPLQRPTARRKTMSPTQPCPDSAARRASVDQQATTPSPRRQSAAVRTTSKLSVASPRTPRQQAPNDVSASIRADTLETDTEKVCRSLAAYRKQLATSPETVSLEKIKELEKELRLTAKAIGDKAARQKSEMERMLSEYSDKLAKLASDQEEAVVGQVDGKRMEQ